jgi:hypothetical protein
MPDFSQLLRKPAGEAKRPPPLPIGDYPAVIKSQEVGDNNRNKTPYVRLALVLTDWPENVAEYDRPEGVDLNKRQLRKDFYLTEDSLWRLDEFIRSCDIDPNGRPYEEILPELIGKPVTVEVLHYINQQTSEIGNNTGAVVGQNGSK